MTYTKNFLILCLIASSAVAAVGKGRTVPVAVSSREHIAAVHVNEDGSTVVAITSNAPARSRILAVSAAGITTEVSVPDLRVNRVTPLPGNALFVGGTPVSGAEAEYRYRLLNVGPSGVTVAWDSIHLGDGEHVVMPNATGKLWAAAFPAKDKLVLSVGMFPDYAPRLKVEIPAPAGIAKQLRLDPEYASIVFLNDETNAPLLAVQWLGASFIVEGAASGKSGGVRQVLTAPQGTVSFTRRDSISDLLWLKSGATWTAFDVQAARQGKRRVVAEIDKAAVGGEPVELTPAGVGKVAVTTVDSTGRWRLHTVRIDTRTVVQSETLPAYQHWMTSQGGHAMAALPQGAKSKAVVVHTIW
ncbi:MAG: hypothetical protein AABO58_00390 [Acidobacteriota bacterium]